jgi:hypothetical protein
VLQTRWNQPERALKMTHVCHRGTPPATRRARAAIPMPPSARQSVLRHLLPSAQLPSAATDPAAYIAWLEQQLDATTAACASTSALETKVDALVQLCAQTEERLLALARLVKIQAKTQEEAEAVHRRVVADLQHRVLTLEQGVSGGGAGGGAGSTSIARGRGEQAGAWLRGHEEARAETTDVDSITASAFDAEARRRRVLSMYADLATDFR